MATYRPDPANGWLAAVRGPVVLLAPSTAASDLVALWPHLGADDPTPHVLDRLTAAGLAATPPFALVVRHADGEDARVVARGGVTVRVGDTSISGAGVSTWTERVIDAGASAIVVRTDVEGSDAGAELPIVEGIVPAHTVSSRAGEAVAPSAHAASEAPAAASVPSVMAPAAIAEAAPAPTSRPTEPVGSPTPSVIVSAPPVAPSEQTMVPAEDTIAAPITPPRPASTVEPAPDAGGLDGDHDGLTVASVDLRRLRAERVARGGGSTPASGIPVASAPRSSLRMPDGAIEQIGHEVVLGRAPSVSQVSGGRIPRLITIGAGDPDISRNHVRLAVEGDTVVVTDLHSRNGTHVVAPGKAPVKLRAGEPTPVLAGTVVDLGGGWTVQVVGG